jgi:hypothetical protein
MSAASKDSALREQGAVDKSKTVISDSKASGKRVKENYVTFSTKCYIIRCAGCGLLTDTTRADSLTCSPACRVLGHRNGGTDKVRYMAKSAGASPGMIVRCQAVLELRPDLADRIRTGEIDIDDTDVRREMAASFAALVMRTIGALQSDADAMRGG